MASIRMTKKATVKLDLAAAIATGKYPPGSRLSGEHQLAIEFGVSRPTLRSALDELTKEQKIVKLRGSGTYVCSPKKMTRGSLESHIPQVSGINENLPQVSTNKAVTVNVPVYDPKKILSIHFWGKLLEHTHLSSTPISLNLIKYKLPFDNSSRQQSIVRLFSQINPVGLFEIYLRDLRWFVNAGLCEDLTPRFRDWTQSKNIYPAALEATTFKRRLYGLPFHASLSGIAYNKILFHRLNIDPFEAMSSLDNFVMATEKLADSGQCKHSFWGMTVTNMVMHLLRAFYDNLDQRFGIDSSDPIEKEVGIEILKLLKLFGTKMKVKAVRNYCDIDNDQYLHDYKTGAFGMVLDVLSRKYTNFSEDNEESPMAFAPLAFTKQKRPFCLLAANVWIINPSIDSAAKDFIWAFLADYVQPASDYELDRRHLEVGQVNGRNNVFIDKGSRVPEDTDYNIREKELYAYAEQAIPFPSPVFDEFVESAQRMLFDSSLNPTSEYAFYLAKVDNVSSSDFEKMQPRV